MATALSTFVGRMRCLAAREGLGHLTDGQLLNLFVSRGDQEAFTVLVWRHGNSVWNVCRQLVRAQEDADDAFQATFLTLVRRAGGIRQPEMVGGWLRKVAIRVALDARAKDAKRSRHEKQLGDLREIQDTSGRHATWDIRLPVIEEVGRLPERFRLAVVLCYLEGKTVQEAAELLDCPRGTILSRLARARSKLCRRLSSRGVTMTNGSLLLALAGQEGPSPLRAAQVEATVRTVSTHIRMAAGGLASNAAVLSEGVLTSMFLTKSKMIAAIVLVSSILGGGAAALLHQARAGEDSESASVHAWIGADTLATAGQDTHQKQPGNVAPPKKFDNAPGWRWFFAPCPPASRDMAEKGMVCLVDRDHDGAQLVYLAFSGTFDRSHPEFRPVVFDAEGKRYVADPERGGSTGKFGKTVSMVRFRLDPKQLPQQKVTEIGVEER